MVRYELGSGDLRSWTPSIEIYRPDYCAPLAYQGSDLLVVAGAGVSLAMPAAQNAVLNAVAPSEIGKASGVFNMLRFLGGVCGVAILAAAFAANGDFDSAAAFSVAG